MSFIASTIKKLFKLVALPFQLAFRAVGAMARVAVKPFAALFAIVFKWPVALLSTYKAAKNHKGLMALAGAMELARRLAKSDEAPEAKAS